MTGQKEKYRGHWKDLSEDGGRTAIRNRRHHWIRRAQVAAWMLQEIPGPVASLHDLGCGEMLIRSSLPPGIAYFGYDEIENPGVIPINLDGELPDINPEHPSVAMFLGVFEGRGPHLKPLLQWVSSHFTWILASYTAAKWRTRPPWATRSPQQAIANLLAEQGTIRKEHNFRKHHLYLVETGVFDEASE